MRIIDAITQLQNVKPNQYDEALMVAWLSDVDGLIYNEYIKWHEQPKTEEEPEPEVPEEPEEAPTLPDKDTLANTSWADIKTVADAGLMDDYGWAYHDTKTITFAEPVRGSSSITMEYVGKNYDDLPDGSGKAPMSFLMKVGFDRVDSMHSVDGLIGGWSKSDFYNGYLYDYIDEVYYGLPNILKAIEDVIGADIISPVIKYTTKDDTGENIEGIVTKLWQPSRYEVEGAGANLDNFNEKPSDITGPYPVFTSDNSRIKTSTDYAWWLRTVASETNSYVFFNSVDKRGAIGSTHVIAAGTVVIGFCVGHPKPAPEPQPEPEPERVKPPYDPELDMDTVLLVPEPYSNLYVKYLAAQVDYFNGELARYDNSMTLFNAALSAFADWYNRNNMPRQDNYIIF